MTDRVGIPINLQNDDFRFIKIAPGEKIPLEKSWQEKNNYAWNDPELQEHLDKGGNYGVVCGCGGLVVIDADKPEVEKAVGENLPETFAVRTGGGDHHSYYVCKDLDRPIRLKEEKEGDLGDIQYTGKQVVGPNSIHPNGRKYEVEKNLPIREISAEEIRFALKDFLKDESAGVIREEKGGQVTAEVLEGKGPDETNIIDFIEDGSALRIFTDSGRWQYLPGRIDGNGFSPIGSSEASSVKPWENSKQLRGRLRPRLKSVGINDPDSFLEKIAEELNRCGREDYFLPEPEFEGKSEGEFDPEEIPEIYEWEAGSIISDGDVLPQVLEFYGQAHIGDHARKLILFISSLSKNLSGISINDYSVGTSGKGKSALARMMIRGIPNEYKLVRESISSKYLQYLTQKYGEDCLDGIVLFYDDVTVDEEKEATLKAVSDPLGDEVRHGTVIDQEVVDLNIKGKPVVWVNTVEPFESNQMRNRFFIDQPDESPELDREVAEFQKEQIRRGILSPEDRLDYNIMKALYKKLTEQNLADLVVLVPFDWEWKYETDRRLEPLFGRLLNVITKIHAPLRVRIDGNGKSYLLATPEDFYIAKFIVNSFLVQTASKLTDRQIRVWKSLPPSSASIENGATRSGVSEETQISQGKVRHDLDALMDEGWAHGKRCGKNWEWHYKKTQKKAAKSCVECSQGCADFGGLQKEFEETLKGCEISGDSLRDNTSLWVKYKRGICFSRLARISQALELQENDLDSLVEVDHACELTSQLLATCKQELEKAAVDKKSEKENSEAESTEKVHPDLEREIAQKLLWDGPKTAEEIRSELDIEDTQFNEAFNRLAESGKIVPRDGKWVHKENILGPEGDGGG